ncbi:unnamed protein product [Symbiodinium sp. CCMP2592]|nr:unnamed protein product [Symbiodinium sp. CCMP2592]
MTGRVGSVTAVGLTDTAAHTGPSGYSHAYGKYGNYGNYGGYGYGYTAYGYGMSFAKGDEAQTSKLLPFPCAWFAFIGVLDSTLHVVAWPSSNCEGPGPWHARQGHLAGWKSKEGHRKDSKDAKEGERDTLEKPEKEEEAAPRVKDEVFEAGSELQHQFFDARVRQWLGIFTRCTAPADGARRERCPDVKNWPAYLVTLLKKFDADAAPQARIRALARVTELPARVKDRQERLEEGKEGLWLCIHGLYHSGEVATATAADRAVLSSAEAAEVPTASPRSGQEASVVEARSQPVATRRRCMGGEETLANLAFLESDDLRIQNPFFEFASMGDRLRTAAHSSKKSKRIVVSCTGDSEDEEGDEARAKWTSVPKSSESRQFFPPPPAQSSLEILEAPGLEQGFGGEVTELATSNGRNAELELGQSRQLGQLGRLGHPGPGPRAAQAGPNGPNPHAAPNALPAGTVGTGPASLSVNGLPPAHPFAYPFEGPKTKTVPGNIGFGLQTTPTPMPATAGERLGQLGAMSSLSSRHESMPQHGCTCASKAFWREAWQRIPALECRVLKDLHWPPPASALCARFFR